jgi:hypothetical protein
VGRLPQAPLLRGPRASGLGSSLWVCQAIFSGKLEMLTRVHAPFKILLKFLNEVNYSAVVFIMWDSIWFPFVKVQDL